MANKFSIVAKKATHGHSRTENNILVISNKFSEEVEHGLFSTEKKNTRYQQRSDHKMTEPVLNGL